MDCYFSLFLFRKQEGKNIMKLGIVEITIFVGGEDLFAFLEGQEVRAHVLPIGCFALKMDVFYLSFKKEPGDDGGTFVKFIGDKSGD